MSARSLERLYTMAPDAFGVAEPEILSAADIPEKLVCCLWFEPRWRPERLETLTGRPFKVRSPGQWNRQAGPDFLQAVLEYSDGERCRGDVEVHRLASGWTAHRHHLDARYNRVILHVVLRNDRSSHEVSRADGRTIPQVALEPLLPRPLTAYREAIPLADYPNKHAPRIGQCYMTLRTLPPRDVQRFLERAGEVRLEKHMRHWAQRVWLVGPAQAMYEAVLRSLGASGYGPRFLDIARRLTWKESQQWLSGCDTAERPIVADALLLGTAGLLQQALEMSHAMDGETQVYVSALQHAWTHLPGDVQCLAGPQIDWQHPHVRPMNTPERRLAGMAQLLARYGDTDLYQAALVRCRASRGQTLTRRARSLNRALIDMLQMPTHTYWGARSRFGTRPGRLQRLIGRQRALTIVVDAMLPLLLCEAYAQGAGALQQLLLTGYREAPRLPDNATLRDMSRRLLGDDPPLLALVTHARHQQGMLQVFEDYCSHDEGGCQGCGFPPL